MVYIPPPTLSVAEQKCYLLNEGNNQAIVQCLEAYSDSQAAGVVCVIIFFIIVAWLMKKFL